MNVQYAIKDGTIYVLEVNPRASRTVRPNRMASDTAPAIVPRRRSRPVIAVAASWMLPPLATAIARDRSSSR